LQIKISINAEAPIPVKAVSVFIVLQRYVKVIKSLGPIVTLKWFKQMLTLCAQNAVLNSNHKFVMTITVINFVTLDNTIGVVLAVLAVWP
jgi:hypothetical protein